MAKVPWRAQVDIPYGETDPLMTVFMGTVFTDADTGEIFVRQDTSDPVQMNLSELQDAMKLADATEMRRKLAEQQAEVLLTAEAAIDAK